MTRFRVALFALLLLALGVGTWASGAQGDDDDGTFVYAAKFFCGTNTSQAAPAKPGDYETAINVHNPQSKTAWLKKKAIQTFPQSDPNAFEPQEGPSAFRREPLNENWGKEVDCRDIRQLLGRPQDTAFIKGFVVIESRSKLDVVGGYTGQGLRQKDATNPPPGGPNPGGRCNSPQECQQIEGFSEDVETVVPTRRGEDDDD
jgi:hypothetical protein